MKIIKRLLFNAVVLLAVPALGWANPGSNNCEVATTSEVEQLFADWNAALQTGDPKQVTALYAPNAILLPTLSNIPRITPKEIESYFITFLKQHPYGKIDSHIIRNGCNWAIDTGLYTFMFGQEGRKEAVNARFSFIYEYINGKWLIVSHHSSLLPNAKDPKEDREEMSELELGHE